MKQAHRKYLNGVLVCLSVMLIMFANALSSPLLTYIAADLNTDVAVAGYLPTVLTLFMGVFVLVGTPLLEKLGLRKSMILGMLLYALGNVATFCFHSFLLILVGRALCGAGMGIMGSGFSFVVATCFQGKGQSAFVTIYTLGNTLASYLSFRAAIPFFHLMDDSWRTCHLIMGAASALLALAWLILSQEVTVERNGKEREEPALLQAMRSRAVWILVIYHGLATLSTNVITNYLPSYLHLVRDFSDVQAANWSGILSLTGMVGTLVGGSISTLLGRRKPVIISGVILSLVSMVGILTVKADWCIAACIAIFGFASRYRIPATSSASTEIRPSNPVFSSAAYALMYSLSSLLGVGAPPILSRATASFGMDKGMLLFALLLAVAVIFALFVKETGPKGRLNVKAVNDAQIGRMADSLANELHSPRR